MKSLMCSLSVRMLAEAGVRCNVATDMDHRTMVHRVRDEGEGFLTITLPALATHLERCVADGKWTPLGAFKHRQGLPVFLRGFLSSIFDPCGSLSNNVDVDVLYCLRQVLVLWKKVELPCSDARKKAAYDAFVISNLEVDADYEEISLGSYELFGHISDLLWGNVLRDLDRKVLFRELVPKHGPGATAQRLSGNRKWRLAEWHRRLESDFPAREFLNGFAYWDKSRTANRYQSTIRFLDPGAERPIRVISVPKTQKGPRVIGIEPACNQYCQQALLSEIVQVLEQSRFTRNRVNFTSQLHNRERALASSRDERWASLDLKEASDRVHWGLVDRMLASVPALRRALFASRSAIADVPGHGLVHLNRFASMGSAVCFPIEAMIFYTLIIYSRVLHLNGEDCCLDSITLTQLDRLGEGILVYGDDLFVPTDEATGVAKSLESFGLRVNLQKSFWAGRFRESCGMDAYDGWDITPIRCKHPFPSNSRDASGIVGWTAFGNQLWKHGWWSTASEVRRLVESLLGPLPYVHSQSPMVGWHSHREYQTISRWSKDWARFETRGLVSKGKREKDVLRGRRALVKCLTTIAGSPAVDVDHLMYHDRRGGESIKRQWSPLY